jgi:hypothetical protein
MSQDGLLNLQSLTSGRAAQRRQGLLESLNQQINPDGGIPDKQESFGILGGLIGGGISNLFKSDEQKAREQDEVAFENKDDQVAINIDTNSAESVGEAIQYYRGRGNFKAVQALSGRLGKLNAQAQADSIAESKSALEERRVAESEAAGVSKRADTLADNERADKKLESSILALSSAANSGAVTTKDWDKQFDKLPKEVKEKLRADPTFAGRGSPLNQEQVNKYTRFVVKSRVEDATVKFGEVKDGQLKRDRAFLKTIGTTLGFGGDVDKEEMQDLSSYASKVIGLSGGRGNRNDILEQGASQDKAQRAAVIRNLQMDEAGFNLYTEDDLKSKDEANQPVITPLTELQAKITAEKARISLEDEESEVGSDEVALAAAGAATAGVGIAAYKAAKVTRLEQLKSFPQGINNKRKIAKIEEELKDPVGAIEKERKFLKSRITQMFHKGRGIEVVALRKELKSLDNALEGVVIPKEKGDKPDKRGKGLVKVGSGAKGKAVSAGVNILLGR